MRHHMSGFGWLEGISGMLLLLLGIFTLLWPNKALSTFVVVYGLIAVLTGIRDIVFYVKVETYIGFGPTIALVSGILSVMAGVSIVIYPDAGKWLLALLFPLWFIAHCISRLSQLGHIRIITGKVYYWFSCSLDILGIVLGIMMLIDPVASLLGVSYLVSFYLILFGIEGVITACSGLGDLW